MPIDLSSRDHEVLFERNGTQRLQSTRLARQFGIIFGVPEKRSTVWHRDEQGPYRQRHGLSQRWRAPRMSSCRLAAKVPAETEFIDTYAALGEDGAENSGCCLIEAYYPRYRDAVFCSGKWLCRHEPVQREAAARITDALRIYLVA